MLGGSGIRVQDVRCWGLGCSVLWLRVPGVRVQDVRRSGCWIVGKLARVVWVVGFGIEGLRSRSISARHDELSAGRLVSARS